MRRIGVRVRRDRSEGEEDGSEGEEDRSEGEEG